MPTSVNKRIEFIRSMLPLECFTIARQIQTYRFCDSYLNCKLECNLRDNCSKLFGNVMVPNLDFEETEILFEKYPELRLIGYNLMNS